MQLLSKLLDYYILTIILNNQINLFDRLYINQYMLILCCSYVHCNSSYLDNKQLNWRKKMTNKHICAFHYLQKQKPNWYVIRGREKIASRAGTEESDIETRVKENKEINNYSALHNLISPSKMVVIITFCCYWYWLHVSTEQGNKHWPSHSGWFLCALPHIFNH